MLHHVQDQEYENPEEDEEEEEEDTPAWSRGHKPGSTVKRRFTMQSRDSDGGDEVDDYDEEPPVSILPA